MEPKSSVLEVKFYPSRKSGLLQIQDEERWRKMKDIWAGRGWYGTIRGDQ